MNVNIFKNNLPFLKLFLYRAVYLFISVLKLDILPFSFVGVFGASLKWKLEELQFL